MTKSQVINLNKIPTKAPKDMKKSEVKLLSQQLYQEIGHLQHVLYAERKHSLLVIFQGMDATGKDSATQNVFSRCSPQGLSVQAFKAPTQKELAHDFLWRVHQLVPEKGLIQIFNRSHYEDILIQRVHHWIDMNRVEKRMKAINAFEDLLMFDNNTTILKFYMHTSPSHQLKELKERLEKPEKNWKHNPGDWEERKLWPQYIEAYEYAINNSVIPWHIIPVDNRWYKDYLIAKIVADTLKSLNMILPVLENKSLILGELEKQA